MQPTPGNDYTPFATVEDAYAYAAAYIREQDTATGFTYDGIRLRVNPGFTGIDNAHGAEYFDLVPEGGEFHLYAIP